MTVLAENLKWYKCLTWAEGTTHGGGVDTSSAITDNTSENIFDNVSDAERVDGDTEYRKIFLRNENADSYTLVKAWIDANTPATNTHVTILAGGSKSQQSVDSAALSGTFTFTNGSATVTATNDISKECRPGEKIFNSTEDTNSNAVAIQSVSTDGLTITLASNYGGTGGSGKSAKIAPITSSTFVEPDSISHADALILGTLGENQSIAIWLKRVVTPAGDGYTNDSFTIKVSSS